MANEPGDVTSQYAGATAMGPVQPLDPTDLHGAGAAPADVRYALSPRERDAWQFGVDQAGQVMGQCGAADDPGTVAAGPFDGPYDAGTAQPGVPLYGMAGG
jgi:hypothetical protein